MSIDNKVDDVVVCDFASKYLPSLDTGLYECNKERTDYCQDKILFGYGCFCKKYSVLGKEVKENV